MSHHDPLLRVRHMLDYSREAVELLGSRSLEELRSNRVLQLALVQLIEIVGEAGSRVPDDVRQANPELPWKQAIGMRHRLIHGYEFVDYEIIFDTVRDSLPPLIAQLEKLLR